MTNPEEQLFCAIYSCPPSLDCQAMLYTTLHIAGNQMAFPQRPLWVNERVWNFI